MEDLELNFKPTTHSQAHLQFAQANAKTKNCKRACLFSDATSADTKKTKSFKD